MIIDSHVHLKHGDAQKTEYTPEEVIATMDGAGIDRAIVFAMSTTTQRSTQMVSAAVRQYPTRLIPYAYALPRYDRPVVYELEGAIAHLGFKGIKMHLGECKVEDYVADSVFELAAAYGVPCLIDFGGRMDACATTLRAFPHTKVIICHLGKYLSRDPEELETFIRLAAAHENAYLDASGVALPEMIEEAVRRVGAGRIFFGTDGPHCAKDGPLYEAPDTVAFARAEIARIEALSIRRAEKDAILGGSIAQLLGMEPRS